MLPLYHDNMYEIMPNKNDALVVNLKQNTAKLISKYKEVLAENNHLKEEKINLVNQVENKSQKLSELELRYEKLKLARSLEEAGEDKNSARLKVNRIVREIDKCIALLNK